MEQILQKLGIELNEQTRLSLDSTFQFGCHSKLSCYNSCCSNLDIFLTPYDVLRMKNKLGITSTQFLSEYVEPVIQQESKLPFLRLKFQEGGQCRFVAPEGCTIYSDRPVACRYYPVGFGIHKSQNAHGNDFYFLVREDHCKGFEETQEWTVREWRKNQGIDEYDDNNRIWMDIILHKKLVSPDLEPDEKSLKMFFMASYDIDSFKEFMFESRFLEIFEVEEEELELLKSNEAELMLFAHKWLQYALFKQPTMTVRQQPKA
uniref:YkgJ family cysteine cluster protein n=1 Tax=Chlorobium chlorochromatii (strain CaD3) TaxID=340177 RepID=Q3AR98_CHLCH